jgi:hypothetical protein
MIVSSETAYEMELDALMADGAVAHITLFGGGSGRGVESTHHTKQKKSTIIARTTQIWTID